MVIILHQASGEKIQPWMARSVAHTSVLASAGKARLGDAEECRQGDGGLGTGGKGSGGE